MKLTKSICPFVVAVLLAATLSVGPHMTPTVQAQTSELTQAKLVQEAVLDNGLRVLIKPVRTAPAVSVQTWYRVGSRNEKKGETGLAHQLEHLMFKGTKTRPVQFGQFFNLLGAEANAFTSFDMTAYYETTGADKLDALLQLEADRMVNTLAGPEQLASEKTVVLSELDGYRNNPKSILSDKIQEAAFTTHPYKHVPIGDRDDVVKFTPQMAQDFYQQNYGPNNATLVIVGNVDPKVTLAKVKDYFGSIPARAKPVASVPQEPPQTEERRVTVKQPGSVPILEMLYHGPKSTDPDLYALDLLDNVLNVGRSSRMYQALIETGIAASIGGGISPHIDPGWYGIQAIPSSNTSLETLQQKIDEVLAQVRNEKVTPQELQRAKETARVNLLLGKDNIQEQASTLAYYQTVFGDWKVIDQLAENYRSVTREDLLRVAQKYLLPSNRTVGTFMPTSLGGSLNAVNPDKPESFSPGKPVAPTTLLKYLPPLPKTSQTQVAKPERGVLANGLTYLILPNRSAPTVSIKLNLNAGSGFDTQSNAGLASLTAGLLTSGTKTKTAQEIASLLDNDSIHMGASVRREKASLNAEALAEDTEKVLKIGADVLRNPTFPTDEFQRAQARALVGLKAELDNPSAVARRTFYETVFPADHPFHNQPTLESIQSLKPEDLQKFHQQYYRPDNATLVVVGDVDLVQTKRWIHQYFGTWTDQGKAPTLSATTPAANPKERTVELPGKQQTEVLLGGPGISREDPDYYAALVLNQVLGGNTLSSRLGTRVRDELGLTYGVYSTYVVGNIAGPFIVSMQTNPKDTQRAIDETLKLIDTFRTEGPTAIELANAKRTLIYEFPLKFLSNDDLGSLILSQEEYNLGKDYPERFSSLINKVNLEDIKRVAQKTLNPKNFTQVIIQPTNTAATERSPVSNKP
ncbi:MAG: pitrilysin family protein [Gloeobacterales cyanobacterium]